MEERYGYGSSDERVAKAHFGLDNYTKDAPEYLQRIIKELDFIGQSAVFAKERNDEEKWKSCMERIRKIVEFDSFWIIGFLCDDGGKRREFSVLAKLEKFLPFAWVFETRFIELPTRGIFLEYSDAEEGDEYIEIISGEDAIKRIASSMLLDEASKEDWED